MNHRMEIKAESTLSYLKDRELANNGHLPAQQNTIFMYKGTSGRTGANTVLLSPHLYYTANHRATQLEVSVVINLKVIWDQPSDQNIVNTAELLSCYNMIALGHILHTSVLLQHDTTRPHIAYQCVVTA
jgi:hypothetical protein